MKKEVFEELIVVKRSGQRVNFNNYKIAVAIKQAFDYVYKTYDEKLVNKIYEDVLKYIEINYFKRKTINVEDIQDIIEEILKKEKQMLVYEAFSQYRQKRAASRKVFT
ncbi:MAG: ATP cone domain-containing protein, partial [Bacilli bacterium]|nr:ATP cone domain-containing protein [Bacilli bacterium]